MRALFSILIFGCLYSPALVAGPGQPQSLLAHQFVAEITHLGQFLDGPLPPEASSVKICSCQILAVRTAHGASSELAVLAERTITGHSGSSLARQTLEREKRHLRLFFYDKVKVVSEIERATDCHSLYFQLRSAYAGQLSFDLLDADIAAH
jgi:hypothetical protein